MVVLLLYGVEDDWQHLVVDPLRVLDMEECTEVVDVAASFLLEGLSGLLLPVYFLGD